MVKPAQLLTLRWPLGVHTLADVNQKLEMMKLSKEGVLKATPLVPNRPVVNAKEHSGRN